VTGLVLAATLPIVTWADEGQEVRISAEPDLVDPAVHDGEVEGHSGLATLEPGRPWAIADEDW
jgi:hypothetical protein